MPQIAQQDYIKAVATPGRTPQYDCNVYSVLAKALKAGTLFDVIIVYDNQGSLCQSKILGHVGTRVHFFDERPEDIQNIDLEYTSAQYAALSAIQLEVDRLERGVDDAFPELLNNEGFLSETASEYPICNPDGYKYAVTAADGAITSISVSNELDESDHIVIDEETAQDLIGLHIN